MLPHPIYLDHHATTPVDARVLERMLPFFRENFGNAASKSHPYGWSADAGVATARQEVAALVGAEAREIVFTSGATESTNLAIKGVVHAARDQARRHVVTAATEHKATLDVVRALARDGVSSTILPVAADGTLDPDAVAAAITDDTVLVTLMHANNEVGVVHDIGAIGARCRARGVPLHVDAAQSASVLPVDVVAMGVDLLSLSAHKMYGPKGVGALFVRRKLPLVAQQDGGGHERGLRSGTLNVPGIVGLGAAAALARAERDVDAARLRALRDRLEGLLKDALDDVVVHAAGAPRHPGNLSVAIPFVDAESLMLKTCRVIAVSSGSACTQATLAPSHVLRALGVAHDLAGATIRIGIGRGTTDADIDVAARVLVDTARAIREDSPVARAARGG